MAVKQVEGHTRAKCTQVIIERESTDKKALTASVPAQRRQGNVTSIQHRWASSHTSFPYHPSRWCLQWNSSAALPPWCSASVARPSQVYKRNVLKHKANSYSKNRQNHALYTELAVTYQTSRKHDWCLQVLYRKKHWACRNFSCQCSRIRWPT